MPKFSIVMTYYNRWVQLQNTLRSFIDRGYSDYEIIVVDDASTKEPLTELMLAPFRLPTRLITMPGGAAKYYCNPCIPFNLGIRAARGNIVILQNAECFHAHNILAAAESTLCPKTYVSFACLALDQAASSTLTQPGSLDKIDELSRDLVGSVSYDESGWYNHSRHRPKGYHFTSAFLKADLPALGGGFDRRYAKGIAYDDDELVFRIKRAGFRFIFDDNNYVLHQWHYTSPHVGVGDQFIRNKIILEEITYKEKYLREFGWVRFHLVLAPLYLQALRERFSWLMSAVGLAKKLIKRLMGRP